MKLFAPALTLLAATTLASTAYAQDRTAEDDGIYVTSSIDTVTEYVFRGVSLGGSSVQPSTEISTDFGLSVGAWYSAGLSSDSSVQADEIDLFANYSLPLDGAVSLDIGGTYYHYPQFGSIFETEGGAAGSYEVYGSVGLEDAPLSPSATVYYDFTLENLTLEGSVAHSFDLPRDNWSAELGLTGGHVDSDAGVDYQWGTASLTLNKVITESLHFHVGGNFTINSEDDTLGFDRDVTAGGIEFATRDSDTQFWLGSGLSISY